MIAIEHITTLSSTPWVMWLMLFELVLFVVANIHQPKILLTAWRIVFKRTDRVYNDTAIIGVSSLELRFLCLLVVSFSWMVFFYVGGEFTFGRYMLIMGCVLGWYMLRWGIRKFIMWFGKLKHYGFPQGFMMSLCIVLSIVLYVINIGAVWLSNLKVWRIAMAVVVLVWLIIILIRHFQYFVRTWKAFLALLVYWFTIELGMLVGLYFLINEL